MLKHRNQMLDYATAGFYKQSKTEPHILNLTDRGIGIVVPYLTMSNPQVAVSTRLNPLRYWANITELALNHHIDETDLGMRTLEPAVFNSMFGLGIVKTGIMHEGSSEYMGYLHNVGQVYSDVVDDTDYVADASAKNREAYEFEGHRYRLPTEYAKEFFGSKFADDISADFKRYGEGDEPEGIVKETMIGEDYHTLRQYSEFYDIWLPQEDVIITIRENCDKILRTVEWEGPERGPFDCLGYKYFPNSPIPIPPVWGWLDMDTMINIIIMKMKEQAEAQKKILAYESGSADDAERIASAANNATVKVDNIQGISTLEWGGINPEAYQWISYIESQFSVQGGNLYTMGGRNVMAETLGQEQMLMANASRLLDSMVNKVYEFVQRIMRKRAWFLWTDPLINLPEIQRVPGFGDIQVVFNQTAKEGNFYDFNFKVKPYSMQRFNPTIMSNKMSRFLSQWIMPILPLAAQQGYKIDINEVTKELAKLEGIDIENWWQPGTPEGMEINPYVPPPGQKTSSSGQPSKSPGQGNDAFGASTPSREANLNQQQNREGITV